MLKNNLKIALRLIAKDKLQSFIKVLGLTIGAVSFLLIGLYISDQFGYDTAFSDADRIYRLHTQIRSIADGEMNLNSATGSPPVGPGMKAEIPGIAEVTRVVKGEFLLSSPKIPDGTFEANGYSADPSFFNIFDYPFLEGGGENALVGDNQVVLSAGLAQKFFGEQSAFGQVLFMGSAEDKIPLKVTGVFEDKGIKTHIHPSYVLSMGTTGLGSFINSTDNWVGQNFVTQYFKLTEGANPLVVERAANDLLQRKAAEDLKSTGMAKTLYLQPIQDIYLKSGGISNHLYKVSSMQYIQLLGSIAFFILLMAAANYINLTTAQTGRRNKEIGVRKVNGASENSLAAQFLTESYVLAFIAVLISIPLVIAFLPFFNQLTDGQLDISLLFQLQFVLIIFLLPFFSGLVSGLYPALHQAKVKPVANLKKAGNKKSLPELMKSGLVVFQFALVFILIYSVLLVNKQIDFIHQKDLGFNYENKLVIPLKTGNAQKQFAAIQAELSGLSSVESVSGVEFKPSTPVLYDTRVYRNPTEDNAPISIKMNLVSPGYFENMGILFLDGRDVAANDDNQVVVNEAFLRHFGIDHKEAIGKVLYTKTDEGLTEPLEVIGVVSDFNQVSLKEQVVPTMHYFAKTPDHMIIETKAGSDADVLAAAGRLWSSVLPGEPFEFSYLSDSIGAMYKDEQKARGIGFAFSLLAILLGILGIWGLVNHAMNQRFKEIGLRKTLGATFSQIYFLVGKKYLYLVSIAAVLGVPAAIVFSKKWLANFEYQTDHPSTLLIPAFLITILVAVGSMSYSIIKAANLNPVDSLKVE
ncbi:MAG: ABC transporter permease [Saprospiraceae bacterium]|nr:ABC transporter permease [Saprospiraceae bacterium]